MRNIRLDEGIEIPILGFGTWQLSGEVCVTSVTKALEVGYRHIDTADGYGNHKEVALAIKGSGIARSDLFITTKVPRTLLHKQDLIEAAKRYLEEMETEYIDLLLIHWPNKEIPIPESLEAMNQLKQEGLIRSIGVSNFTPHHLEDVLDTGIKVVNNQVELHPEFNQKELVSFAKEHNITVTAYSPIGRGASLQLPKVIELAEKHSKTPSQIVLAWIMQQDIIAIPKSTNPVHIQENFEATEITLSEEDTNILNQIQQEDRLVNPAHGEFDY